MTKKKAWLLTGGAVGLLAALYLGVYAFTGDKIARGTTIAGVDVGGMTAEQARVALRDLDEAQQSLTLTASGASITVAPVEAGLSIDVEASVDQVATGRSLDPRDLWSYLAGGTDEPAQVTTDDELLSGTIGSLADQVDDPGVEAGIRFTKQGKAIASYPEPGRAVDVLAGKELLVAAYAKQDVGSVQVPVEMVTPDITTEAVDQALQDFAEPAMSAPVVFRIAGDRVKLEPRAYAAALSMQAADDALEPALNKKALRKVVDEAMDAVSLDPRDATVQIVDGKPQVVPGKTGVTYDPQAVLDGFLDLVARPPGDRVLKVPTKIRTPDYTADQVRELGIKEVVSEFTTEFPYAEYRNINIGRAAELIDGTVLKPGETFSLNQTVGERTAENGFTKGFIISNGVFKQDLGGGVSQVATTTFNAAFFAGLKDVEHKPHSFYIDRYPVGREATVAWPTVDLRFTNDTPYGILIQAWRTNSTPSTQGTMNVRMWSTKYWKIEATESARYNFTSPATRRIAGPDCEPNVGYGGFDIDVYRWFYKPGSDKVVRKETMHTHYTPADTVICTG